MSWRRSSKQASSAARPPTNCGSARAAPSGLCLLDIANPFFGEMVRGAERVLRDKGYVLMVCSSDESTEREHRYLRVLEEHRVDGLLITPVERDLKTVAGLARRGIPTVLLDRDAGSLDLCSVTVDDVRGGELAASHLVDLGHAVIGFVNGPLSIRQCADRLDGARRALRRARRQSRPVLVEIAVSARSRWTTAKLPSGRSWLPRPARRRSCVPTTS